MSLKGLKKQKGREGDTNYKFSFFSNTGRSLEVFRITVDERLDNSTVRLLFAPLKNSKKKRGAKINIKGDGDWGPERSMTVSRDDFFAYSSQIKKRKWLIRIVKEVIGNLAQEVSTELLWPALKEGQVFLVGDFFVKGLRYDPDELTVQGSTPREFLRIDGIRSFKDESLRLYSRALCGKETTHG